MTSTPNDVPGQHWQHVLLYDFWHNHTPIFPEHARPWFAEKLIWHLIGFAVSGVDLILLRNFAEGLPNPVKEAARMDAVNDFLVL